MKTNNSKSNGKLTPYQIRRIAETVAAQVLPNPAPATVNLPSAESLAMIAANVAAGREPGDAIHYAFELWREAGRKLWFEGSAQESRDRDPGVPMPASFPADIKDFYRLIIPTTKTEGDAQGRFKDFLRSRERRGYTAEYLAEKAEKIGKEKFEDMLEGRILKRMKSYRERGIVTHAAWVALAEDYRSWWGEQVSTKSRQSAKARRGY